MTHQLPHSPQINTRYDHSACENMLQ